MSFMSKINLPTRITLARIVLVAGLLAALFGCWIANRSTGWVSPNLGLAHGRSISLINLIVCIVFVVAASTDALDGYLARSRNEVTDLGKFLDPVADKMLVNSMLVYLAIPAGFNQNAQLTIPAFCVILMVIRDLVVDALRFIAAEKKVVIAANIFGKLKTVFQMVAIPFALLNSFPFFYFDGAWVNELRIANILIYLATLMSVISGVIYVVQNRGVLAQSKEKKQ